MDELYREQILEHYKHPHNFGRIEDPDLEFEDNNPFCGDEQHVGVPRVRCVGVIGAAVHTRHHAVIANDAAEAA